MHLKLLINRSNEAISNKWLFDPLKWLVLCRYQLFKIIISLATRAADGKNMVDTIR